MKYIMLETKDGQKLPVLFPDCVNHVDMARGAKRALLTGHGVDAEVVSAGFVDVGLDVSVHGRSESLGDLPHNPADAARIMAGDSVAFMPDAILGPLIERLRAKR